ncbi:porphobilinogen deaminase-like protein [Nonomuraea fuscirosea]|uniref:Porphobilinogen deaminase-like protein n=1 Tax=Nonomuraea fuscirosea TaxID=1291556 RepID=A0A2T0LJW6_9ACTN|nr:hypothetical protein [Nonomuraea fuscirosea]PRX42921.1 porphobilinogen deaminase-like protein [Nonomuraea fuscirosea]
MPDHDTGASGWPRSFRYRIWNAVTAERALLSALDPGNRFVVGGYAANDGHLVSLTAAVLSADGKHLARSCGTCTSVADAAADLRQLLGADLHVVADSWPALTAHATTETA